MDVLIEKNIPIPPTVRGPRECKYPWRTMEVNDSFFTAGAKRNTMSSLATIMSKNLGVKFSVREAEKDGVRGVRVWRIK